ncbi:MAG TPA: M23 family metallopeptidase [Magnetospirillum sp.]|nr:M23 family metallopeptidase [Magnetospirillum sp.]
MALAASSSRVSILSVLVVTLLLGGGAEAAERLDLHTVQKALIGTGIHIEALLRRHDEEGRGGPFIPVGPEALPPDKAERLDRALTVLPLAPPLAKYVMSSGFGIRRDPINHRRAMHTGIDLRAPLRSPVLATAPGKVVFAGRKQGYGRMVEIDHGMGVHTRYGHLAAIAAHPGQMVNAGARVGLLGNSGRSTGPHLHYEVLVDGRPRNPLPFLRAGQKLGRGEPVLVSGSVPPATDRPHRGSHAAPNSRGCPCP